ncbi:SpoU rRNA methylase family-domain-containing protein [Scenedesmus sp. NREL 46B-D3]|nr:SpoU rRNA methylase family-domain-containing protein [Scenedesmus sp. NREL 46B-D3]
MQTQLQASRPRLASQQWATKAAAAVRLHSSSSSSSRLTQRALSADDEQLIPAGAAHVLDQVRVVLVAPKTPANIGAVARGCANFETTHLWVVAPRCDPYIGEVEKVACGEEVLKRMTVVNDLQQALNDTIGSVGFTRRAGATRYTHGSIAELLQKYPAAIAALDPAQSASQQQQQQQDGSSLGQTALVFGREESGLTEAELRLCSHSCAIPTGRIQGSMNLSHAVAVVLSCLFERRLQLLGLADLGIEVSGKQESWEGLQPAAASELSALLNKISAIASSVGMSGEDSRGGGAQGSHGRRRLPLGHIRAILSRAQANTWEVRSLHGLASAVLKHVEEDTTADNGGSDSGS